MTTRKYYAMHRRGKIARAFDSKGLRDYYVLQRWDFNACTAKEARNINVVIEDMSDPNNWYGGDNHIINHYTYGM